MKRILGLVVGLAALAFVSTARGDETSTADKLRILYSSRFTFTDDGLPLVTVEVMSGQRQVTLSAPGGLVILPDGPGGSATTVTGATSIVVTGEAAEAADIREWTVVERLAPDDASGIATAMETYKKRGLDPHGFEIGTLFAVDGEVIDSREHLITVPKGKATGTGEVHRELVRRPRGTIVAKLGDTTVKNPSVLWFRPARASDTITVRDVPTNTGGSQLTTGHEDRRYWGAVYVTFGSDGTLTAVNAVAEDKLLAGLVPSEIFPDAPEAALEAQAIAARTELLEKIGRRNLTEPYLLCSTQQCQVYAGAGKEHPRTTRAVEKTRGVVMLRDGGGLVDARYSASAGGRTEDNDAIWGGTPDPSLRGRADTTDRRLAEKFAVIDDKNLEAFLAASPDAFWSGATRWGKKHFRWTVETSAKDLSAHVARVYPAVGTVTALEVVRRGRSGRVQSLRVVGSKSTVVADGDLHIRRLLGGLKSTLFTVTARGGTFTFRGAGFGHGVGMDQVGAIGMADAGKSHAAILANYYRGMHLHRLY
jgi:stage II sporulation protein D